MILREAVSLGRMLYRMGYIYAWEDVNVGEIRFDSIELFLFNLNDFLYV